MSKNDKNIVINEFYLPDKPTFMSKQRLAVELDMSTQTIDNYIKNMVLKEEVHFIRRERKIQFFYMQILKNFAPRFSDFIKETE